MVGGDVPFYVKMWPKLIHAFKNADFQSIFARSASAVTPSEKKFNYINTNMKSTTSFPISLRWTVYVVWKCTPCFKKNIHSYYWL